MAAFSSSLSWKNLLFFTVRRSVYGLLNGSESPKTYPLEHFLDVLIR